MVEIINHNQPAIPNGPEIPPPQRLLSSLFSKSVKAMSSVYTRSMNFCFAVWQKNVTGEIDLSLVLGADPNIRIDPFGWTPFHAAVQSGNRKRVHELLKNGADPNLLHDAGWSPFHVAIYLNDLEIIQDLMEAGANYYDTIVEEVKAKSLPLCLWVREGGPDEQRVKAYEKINQCAREKSAELGLTSLQLTTLPAEIGQLSALQTLSLRNNRLTTLPPEIGRLSTLQVLYLHSNKLSELPPEIGQLSALQTLYLGSNELSKLPSEIGQLSALQVLSLGHNKLPELPPEIGQLSVLYDLRLNDNELSELPPEIGQLPALQVLYLGNNELSELPSEIGQLSVLQTLGLRNNELSELPPEIGQLSALQTLNLHSNRLTTLPPEIGQLSALQTLHLNFNRLSELPSEIGQLSALNQLDLDYNSDLTSFPEEILQLPANCEVIIDGTGLSEVVLNRLRDTANASDRAGLQFRNSIWWRWLEERHQVFSGNLEEILQDLIELTEIDSLNISNLVADEGQKTILTTWLNKLCYISGFQGRSEKHKKLARHVVSYLQLAQEDSDYRILFFAIIEGAAGSCGDNMATSILDLGIAYKEFTIPKEDYQSLAKFLANTKWAISLLREIARAKVASLGFPDVIETYLAYPVKLKLDLGLDIPIDDMLFFEHWSNVSEADLANAKQYVLEERRQNHKACLRFLVEQNKWVEALKVHYGSQIEAANEKRHEDYDNEAYFDTLVRFTEQLLGEEFFSS